MAQARQRSVAGVTIGEPLGETGYGSTFRATSPSRRDLVALNVDGALATHAPFRAALLEPARREAVIAFDHPAVVRTLAIEEAGSDIVVVTLGGRDARTVAELLVAGPGPGGRLAPEIVATVARALSTGLAALHARGLVHGAVHPRSVYVSSDHGLQLGDLAVGSALGRAIAQGVDEDLWRSLRGHLPSETLMGTPPGARADVFGAGALIHALLTGDAPPGALRTTPAVERVLHRALESEPSRRHRDAGELAEQLLEALDDDRWSFASPAEVLAAAGGPLPLSEGGLDDATEDLLASLGSNVRNRPTRPSVDLRAEQAAARQATRGEPRSSGGLDALLADIEDGREELTAVEERPLHDRDPVSELISIEAVKRAALEGARPPRAKQATAPPPQGVRLPAAPPRSSPATGAPPLRTAPPTGAPPRGKPASIAPPLRIGVPSSVPPPRANKPTPGLMPMARRGSEFGDDETPLPAPQVEDSGLLAFGHAPRGARPPSGTPAPVAATRPPSGSPARADAGDAADADAADRDAAAAFSALDDLDQVSGVRPRPSSKAPPMARATTDRVRPLPRPSASPESSRTDDDRVAERGPARAPIAAGFDPSALDGSLEVPRLARRGVGAFFALLTLAGLVLIVWVFLGQADERKQREAEQHAREAAAAAETARLAAALVDEGAIRIGSNPDQGVVWLQLGRTPLTTALTVPTDQLLQLRVELDGFVTQDVPVFASAWKGADPKQRRARFEIDLVPAPATGAPLLPADPGKPAAAGAEAYSPGRGTIEVTSTPAGAAVWLLVGITNSMEYRGLPAGKPYDLRVAKDGYVPGYVSITPDDWRAGGNPAEPIDSAPKLSVIERNVELVVRPTTKPPRTKRPR